MTGLNIKGFGKPAPQAGEFLKSYLPDCKINLPNICILVCNSTKIYNCDRMFTWPKPQDLLVPPPILHVTGRREMFILSINNVEFLGLLPLC